MWYIDFSDVIIYYNIFISYKLQTFTDITENYNYHYKTKVTYNYKVTFMIYMYKL